MATRSAAPLKVVSTWRTHFACRVGTLPTPGYSRKTGVEKVSTRHVENVRYMNSQAKVKPAEADRLKGGGFEPGD
jgi:hypothetical protein